MIYPQQQRLCCSDTAAVEEESRECFISNGEVYEKLGLPPAAEDCDSDTGCRGGEQDVFNSNGEVYETLVIYPQQQRL